MQGEPAGGAPKPAARCPLDMKGYLPSGTEWRPLGASAPPMPQPHTALHPIGPGRPDTSLDPVLTGTSREWALDGTQNLQGPLGGQ